MMNIMQKAKHFARHSTLIKNNFAVMPFVLAGYFKTLVLGQNVLRTLELTVTADCNVNCEMCYAKRIKQNGRDYLTPGDYNNIWKQAKRLGAFSVILSGGEPTMRSDLFDIISVLDPNRTMIALVTNSTFLDGTLLKELKNSGVNVIHLSLNSIDAEENDRIRDFKGHFFKVSAMIDQAKAQGFEVCLSTVVSHNELDRTIKIVEFGAKRHVGVVFSLACPTGNWAGAKEYLLTADEWVQVQQIMYRNPHVRSDWTINFSMRTECPGGREKLCISPYGEVMGCGMNFISHGNVLEEPLEEIWRRTCNWSQFKKRSKKCLIALDEEYLNDYLLPVAGNDVLPVPLSDHPNKKLDKTS